MLPERHDDPLRLALAAYQPEPPVWLAARIIANATAQPQKQGLFGFLRRAFCEWDYALQFKGVALAAFAVLGLLSAQFTTNSHHALDVRNVLMADPNWTEEL